MITTRELIEVLLGYPPDTRVLVVYPGPSGRTVLDDIIQISPNGNAIQLEVEGWRKEIAS